MDEWDESAGLAGWSLPMRHRIGTTAAGEAIEICARNGGTGPPLLLLHGFPQTHVMWRRVARLLSPHFTLVLADLRGYGDSTKPADGRDHAGHSKRAMADDMLALMRAFGHERFGVVGHDRGGRVAHRLALDHADAVSRLAVIDIDPRPQLHRFGETTGVRIVEAITDLLTEGSRPRRAEPVAVQ